MAAAIAIEAARIISSLVLQGHKSQAGNLSRPARAQFQDHADDNLAASGRRK
jgi:hypothetical protein